MKTDHKKRNIRSAILVFFRELGFFFKGAALNIFSIEFLTVLVPLLVLWECLPRFGVLPRTLIPLPSDVAVTFWEMFTKQNFIKDIGSSMIKFFLGLGIAVITAIPAGILMGWNMAVRKRALPLFQLLSPIPPPAWVPITIILFGIGLPMQTFLIFLGAFYPMRPRRRSDPELLALEQRIGSLFKYDINHESEYAI